MVRDVIVRRRKTRVKGRSLRRYTFVARNL